MSAARVLPPDEPPPPTPPPPKPPKPPFYGNAKTNGEIAFEAYAKARRGLTLIFGALPDHERNAWHAVAIALTRNR